MKKKAWKQKRFRFSERIEIEEYKDGRYGARGQPREKKKKATPEQIKKQNRSNKVRNIRRYILGNFQPGDYWLTITCSREHRPAEMKEALEQRKKFLNNLRTRYRKTGNELKWMAVTERGSRGGVHHHLIVNRIPDGDKMIKELWPFGKAFMELLYEDEGYRKLAEYMVKQTEEASESNYSHSRNLVKTEPEVRYYKKPPKLHIPDGYYLEKESMVEGINPVTGFPYRHYTLVKIKSQNNIKNRNRPKRE